MEIIEIVLIVFIILLIVGGIGYIYFRLPSTRYAKALSRLKAQKTDEAIALLEVIFNKHPDVPSKLAECNYQKGIEYLLYDKEIARSFFNQAIGIKYRFPEKADRNSFEMIEAKAYIEICKINYTYIVSEKSSQNKLKLILDNIQYLDSADTQLGAENEFAELKQKHISELAGLYYLLGINREKIFDFTKAIQMYSEAKDLALASFDREIEANAAARIGICKLKNREPVEDNLLRNINRAGEDFKIDFYFRYVKKLIKEKNYTEAENLIQEYLNIDSPVIEKLKKIIHYAKTRAVISQINAINLTLDGLYVNDFQTENLRSFYDNLNTSIKFIQTTDPALAEKIEELKPGISNRLLAKYIDEEKFSAAINLIQECPDFWENPELLKNLSICSYGFINQGNMDENNYKIIISYYLTGMYSNISSEATRKELLDQFEALLLQKTSNPDLIDAIQNFYSSEKTAIERVIDVIDDIDEDILYPTPYFAKKMNGINETIIAKLNEIYTKQKREDALEAGIPYLLSNLGAHTFLHKYARAKELVQQVDTAIQEEDLNVLISINSDRGKLFVEKFDNINSKVEDILFNSIASKIDDKNMNENLIPIMEEVIRFSGKNEKLKHQYANYIANYCIFRVNSGEIDNTDALSEMEKAYLYSPDNPRICSSIITLIKRNLMDVINLQTKKESEIYLLLDEIYSQRSAVFMQESAGLTEARKQILQVLRNAGIDTSLLDDAVNASLKREPLNEQGERVKKVLFYLKYMSI
jgi:hypothetical protein